jgi:hypothetical protein
MSLPVAVGRSTVLRKLLVTLAVGGVTFALTQLANPGPVWSVAGSVFVGGVVFIVQFLIEVERRLEAAETTQRRHGVSVEQLIDDRFTKVSQATELFGRVEESCLRTDVVVELVRRAARIDDAAPDLVGNFVRSEIARLSEVLERLGEGQDVTYEGEDRDWLLGLTRGIVSTMDATSLSTVDAGGRGFVDGGLWGSELGRRYLDVQRDAIRRRNVRIRRVFIVDRPALVGDPDFLEVCREHARFGIEVRTLNPRKPDVRATSLADVVIFDGVISYETTPATYTTGDRPPLIQDTRLVQDPQRVQDRIQRFNELWELADELPPEGGVAP